LLQAKFALCASSVLKAEAIEAVAQAVEHIDDIIADITQALERL
jgi:O-acetylhomoserine/O-acetylserine sulfhydrylase-like pyridoxal-dependent enzyme